MAKTRVGALEERVMLTLVRLGGESYAVPIAAENPEEIGASSYDYLRLMGLTAFAQTWASMAAVSLPKVEGDNSGFYANKVLTARYFFKRMLPQSAALLETLRGGADDLMAMEAEAF